MIKRLTCIECPMGCAIEVTLEEGKVVSVTGNTCPRGKMYAQNEVTCPRRVLTTTVRTKDGRMVPVKTNAPIKKADMAEIMCAVNRIHPEGDIRVGDVIKANIAENIALVATDTSEAGG